MSVNFYFIYLCIAFLTAVVLAIWKLADHKTTTACLSYWSDGPKKWERWARIETVFEKIKTFMIGFFVICSFLILIYFLLDIFPYCTSITGKLPSFMQ